MMRSTDTWHGRLRLAGLRRGGQHAFGPAGVDHHRAVRWQAAARAGDRAARRCGRARRRCRLRSSARARRRGRGRNRGRRARRRGARRRTASSGRRGRGAPRPASANGASPTPPATIHASAGGSTTVNGRPSGPRHADALAGPRVVEQRRGDADALAQNRDASRCPAGVAQHFEHRKGAAQERIVAARPALTITNCPGRGGGDRRRREREHVVVGRQRVIRDHFRRHVDRHRGSILRMRGAGAARVMML